MLPKAKILAVDDNRINLDIMQHIFGKEYSLMMVESGEEALRVVHEFNPDITILDIMMPGIDGLEVCRRMKADHRLKNNKIIVVSAKAMISERIEGYNAGADDYITKPFESEELLAKVRVFARITDSAGNYIQNGIHELIELIEDSALIINAQGTVCAINNLAIKMFNYSRKEFLGHSVEMIIPLELRKTHKQHADAYFKIPYKREFGRIVNSVGMTKEGKRMHLDIMLVPIHSDNIVKSVVGVMKDLDAIQVVADKITKWMEKLKSIEQMT